MFYKCILFCVRIFTSFQRSPVSFHPYSSTKFFLTVWSSFSQPGLLFKSFRFKFCDCPKNIKSCKLKIFIFFKWQFHPACTSRFFFAKMGWHYKRQTERTHIGNHRLILPEDTIVHWIYAKMVLLTVAIRNKTTLFIQYKMLPLVFDKKCIEKTLFLSLVVRFW